MARDNPKTRNVEKVITDYMKGLYTKKLNGELFTREETESISGQLNLANYLLAGEHTPLYETGSVDHKANGNAPHPSDPNEVSVDLVKKVIKSLLDRSRLEKRDGVLQYVPKAKEALQNFPILKMAEDIQITECPWNDIAFYQVSKSFSTEITNYINAQFYTNDIRAIDLGGLVMCIDLSLGQKSTLVQKRYPLSQRIANILKDFDFRMPSALQDCEIGLSESDVEEELMNDAIASQKYLSKKENSYGGKIQSPSKRKVKKR